MSGGKRQHVRKLTAVWVLAFVLSTLAGVAVAQTPEAPATPAQPSTEAPAATQTTGRTSSASESGSRPPVASGVSRGKVRSHVETTDRVIALTLDDGYHPDSRILDLIADYHLHGTAFLVGQVADSDPGLLRRLSELGWMVCSHTYDHKRLTALSYGSIEREIIRGRDAVARVVGYECPYFRAPYGAVDSRVAAVTDSLGLQIIGWDTSLSDSAPFGTDPRKQFGIALSYLKPGSILLGHFGGMNSYDVLRSLVNWLHQSNYRIGSLTEVFSGQVPATQPDNAAPAIRVPAANTIPLAVGAGLKQSAWTVTLLRPVTDVALAGVALVLVLFFARRRTIRRRRRARRAMLAEIPLLHEIAFATAPLSADDP